MFSPRRYESFIYIFFTLLLLFLPLAVPKWIEFLITIALIYTIAVLGLIPLSGLGGLMSFGNGAFLTLSAYAIGLLIRYLKIDSLALLVIPAILIPIIIAWIFSLLALRTRYIFFALITLAFTMLIYTLLLKFYVYTGGTDGLRIPNIALIKGILDLKVRDPVLGNAYAGYYITVITFVIILFITQRILNSPFALGLAALRDNERRAKDLGINPSILYSYAFVYSALTASLSGILYAISVGHIDPGLAHWTGPSAKIVFIATLGGFTIPGSILAAFIYTVLESYALKYLSYYWQFIVGSVLLLILLTSPKGLLVLLESLPKQILRTQFLTYSKKSHSK
jgi:branched-chain amino acid transport system permease protein